MNLEQLQRKLPVVRDWIESTLAKYRSQFCTVASFGFQRLPQFYLPSLLASVRVIKVARVPVPPLASFGLVEFSEYEQGNYAGITYPGTYFVRSSDASSESVHFHELVHIIQWRHLGVEKFMLAYALGYLSVNANAGRYRNNPLEAMAYDLQADFDRGGQSMDVQAEVITRLHALLPTVLGNVR